MKQFIALTFIFSSLICFGQSGTISSSTATKKDTITICIALKFSPVVTNDKSVDFDTVAYVKQYMSKQQFDFYAKTKWHMSEKCGKKVEVRFFDKDYTFEQFRKLIYER